MRGCVDAVSHTPLTLAFITDSGAGCDCRAHRLSDFSRDKQQVRLDETTDALPSEFLNCVHHGIDLLQGVVDVRRDTETLGVAGRSLSDGYTVFVPERVVNFLRSSIEQLKLYDRSREFRL